MTKKRFKFGLAILGGLTAFLFALLFLVFAPTLASADKGKGFGTSFEHDSHSSNPIYFEPPPAPGHDGANTPGGNAGPCIDTSCKFADNDTHDGAPWHYTGAPDGQDGDHNHDAGDHPHGGQGNPPGPFAGGNIWTPGGFGGGAPGGGFGGGNDPDGKSKSCQADKDDSKSEDGKDKDKNCDADGDHSDNKDKSGDPSGSDTGLVLTSLVNDNPSSFDEEQPDPNCFPFAESCGPRDGGNPPGTGLTDAPTQVPEPLTLSLFAAGLAGAGVLRRRARQK